MNQRTAQINKLAEGKRDVLIIGGGINGASCAASLAVAGMSVALVERGDFASETSQSSSNLVWGGIKYLQNGSIRLVTKLCRSRNTLIRSYPSSVCEIRYFTTLQKSSPPRWLFYAGTWIYWLLGRGFTTVPRLLSAREVKESTGATDCVGGVEYSDAYLPDNDARFTFQFIRNAWLHGAQAVNYVEAIRCRRQSDQWLTTLRDVRNGTELQIKSQLIINAAGPMVDEVNKVNQVETGSRVVFSKGVHLIVPQLTEIKKIMTFFADDGRLFFAIPMGTRTCIGTTDTPQKQWKNEATEGDIQFILENINARMSLRKPLTKDDVIATRSGVRPLAVKKGANTHGDWMKLSRKHVNEVDWDRKYISIYGGKLTDCLNVGNELRAICEQLGYACKNRPWYGEDEGKKAFLAKATHLNKDCLDGIGSSAEKLWRLYGRKADTLLSMMDDEPNLADEIIPGTGVLKVEVKYAAKHEMIVTMEDFLRRRTNLSLCHPLNEAHEAMSEIASILFGNEGNDRLREYYDAHPDQTTSAQGTVKIVAHRGASADAPENTIPAFQLAWKQGSDMIEGDFLLTSDNVIICYHDKTTQRIGGEKLEVNLTPYKQLQNLDAGIWKGPQWKGTRIPTLAQVLETMPMDRGRIFIELKDGIRIIKPLLEQLHKASVATSQISIICLDQDVIASCKKTIPDVDAYWVVSTDSYQKMGTAEMIEITKRVEADGIDIQASMRITPELGQALRENKLQYHCWAVNDIPLARHMVKMGVDSITTDHPALMKKALNIKN